MKFDTSGRDFLQRENLTNASRSDLIEIRAGKVSSL